MARGRVEGTAELSAIQARLLKEALKRTFPSHRSGPTSFELAANHLAEVLKINGKTLAQQIERAVGRNRRRRVLTESLRRYYALLLGEKLVTEILAIEAENFASIPTLRTVTRRRDLTTYQGLKEKGLYRECIELARRGAARASRAKRFLESAEWKAREFSCLRNLGRLKEAIACGKGAKESFDAAPEAERCQGEARLLELRLRFGMTVSSVTMQTADFRHGLAAHKSIEGDARILAIEFAGSEVGEQARAYVLHTRRQQAECFRYLGEYKKALKTARSLEKEYPASDLQPRFWTKIYQADNLRLLGRLDAARALYRNLAAEARLRLQTDSPLAILWRQLALETLSSVYTMEPIIHEIKLSLGSGDNDSIWAVAYAHLTLAAALVQDRARCEDHLESFREVSKPAAENFILENAYASMIAGEMARASGNRRSAIEAYLAAQTLFQSGGILWGQVRASIGIKVVSNRLPAAPFSVQLEGLDQSLWADAQIATPIRPGILCQNFP